MVMQMYLLKTFNEVKHLVFPLYTISVIGFIGGIAFITHNVLLLIISVLFTALAHAWFIVDIGKRGNLPHSNVDGSKDQSKSND